MRRCFALVPVLIAMSAPGSLAHGADRGLAQVALAGKSVSIDYGRPSLAGRDMLAQLQAGQAWRMGADSPTSLKTEADLVFGSAEVPKGEYQLTAKRSAEGKWSLMFGQDKNTVAEVPLSEQKLAQAVEVFTIELTEKGGKGEFLMKWGQMALSTAFRAR